MGGACEAARWALGEGYCPIPIPRGEKNPGLPGWQKLHVSEGDVDRKFAADGNVGLLLGEPSKNLLDVDLDCLEALRLADDLLPKTDLVHGRLGKPRSHRFYTGEEAGATAQFKDPVTKEMLVELRSTGGQTVIPPSTHPSGENLQWERRGRPADVLVKDLRGYVGSVAAASLLVRYYPQKNRHEFTLALVGFLLRRGMTEERVDSTLLAVATAVGPDACRSEDVAHIHSNVRLTTAALAEGRPTTGGRKLAEFLDPKITAKVVEWFSLTGSPLGTGGERDRPVIELRGGELPSIVDAAETALISAIRKELYQRGGLLVRLTRSESETARRGLKRAQGSLVIRPVELPYLVELLTAAASWMKFSPKNGEWFEIDCPERIAKTLAARGTWALKSLTGTIEAPTLRPDGSIVVAPGYDDATGLFYDPGTVSFPELKLDPSREEARAALGIFERLLSGFPFVDQNKERPGSDFSVAVSAILTALVRRSLKSAPLHAFRAPKMGSGKSLLADVVGMIATGRPCAVMSPGEDANEEKKRWLSVLLEGDPVVCIDNIERPLGGSTLCSILTQETYKDRILGMSRTVSVSTAVTLLCTGNNLIFDGDLTTRVIPCDLDPGVERPEERRFDTNLYQYVPEHRAELVVAGLTILRAYVAAGRPPQEISPFGRFEEWSDWVRSALVWLGAADPCAGRSRIEEQDPTRQRLGQLLMAWREAFPGRPVTVAEAIRTAETPIPMEPSADTALIDRLRDSIQAVAADRSGHMNPRYLGNFLSRHAKRIEGGLRFERGDDRNKVATWLVTEVGAQGVPRVSGVIPNARERNPGDLSLGALRDHPQNPANPHAPCFTCRGADWWTSKSGQVVCRRCHPPANEELVS
jgi:hypothetical protein